jgi:hypothetical protein
MAHEVDDPTTSDRSRCLLYVVANEPNLNTDGAGMIL